MDNPMYKALLEWSLKQNDGTRPAALDPAQLDPEKKAFLERVMSEMVEDESSTMIELVAKLHSKEDTEEEAEAKVDALEELSDRVDRIDYAITLHAYAKGFLPVIHLIRDSKHEGVRSKAAELASVCMRNNPDLQLAALEDGGLATIFQAHGNPENGHNCRAKIVGALSALVQNNKTAEAAFLASGGVEALRGDIVSISSKLKLKALFMLQWLLRDCEAARKAAVAGLANDLETVLSEEDDDATEYAAMCLQALVQGDKGAFDAETLRAKVEQRLNTGTVGSGEAETARDALKQLLGLLK
uniref:Nucleotide exchange factor Fes1 domain-containing protein n=1 Tax=Hemiselmis andersenii TaxID=464988 RepID=A0A6U4VG74_HEMAN|mmetsp:Transcript_4689/g.10751  ORF Transcript_4689/g.10751 Transcript_4689/m.10751 type:complete len:300 (+) Transcript_4689:228-1127(+)